MVLGAFPTNPALATTLEGGKVIGVLDGDTIELLTPDRRSVRIRLAQIDAPEKAQPFGQRSKQSLSELVFGKNVSIQIETTDRYGRTVGRVFLDGTDVNLEQVRRGMAWAYRQYLTDQGVLMAEEVARNLKLGLWSEPNPVPPWEYRRKGRVRQESSPSQSQALTDNPQCGNKRTCREMASCEEARMYLTQCGVSSLDRDGDGVPCETLCRK